MEESPNIHMEKTRKISRRTIYTFLQNYQYFTSTPVLLALPFSASILFSQALFLSSSPLLLIAHLCFKSPFHAAGFSPSSQVVSLLNLNLSQMIFTSVFSLPFTLSSFVIAKASIIQALNHHTLSLPPPFSSFISLYKPLLLTHLCNLVLIITVNTASFSLLFVFFKTLQAFGFPPNNPLFALAAGALFYSFVANTVVICNLALVVAGMENCTGYQAIRKAYLLRRGTNSMALLLALPVNLGLPAIEALFCYRVVRAYHLLGRLGASMALEGTLIAYLYSLLIVLDTIASCLFFNYCKSNFRTDQEDRCCYQIEVVVEEENNTSANSKTPEHPRMAF